MKGRDPSDLPRKDQMYRSAGTITTKSTFLSGRGMGVADWVLAPEIFPDSALEATQGQSDSSLVNSHTHATSKR